MPRVGGGVPGNLVGALVRVATGLLSGVMTSGGTLVGETLDGKFFTDLSTATEVEWETGMGAEVVAVGSG